MTNKQVFFEKESKILLKSGPKFLAISFLTMTFSSLCHSSFAATPGCADYNQTPVSTSYLRQIATYRGIINSNMSTLTQNRRIGR